MHRPVSATSILVFCAAALLAPACSPEEDPGFESGTWAGAHRREIEIDCDRRYVCAQRTADHLTEAAFDNCLTDQAMKLNADAAAQFKFQLSMMRCPNMDECRYVECADSGFVSYGEQQLPKVQYTCQQKVQCSIDNQMLANDPNAAFESCVLQSVQVLDTFPNESRIDFQESFFPCMPMTSCAFITCFGY